MKAQKNLVLNTGATMPSVGLGTWKSAPEEAGEAVAYALSEAGYTHVDCAAAYNNEAEIGRAFERVFKKGDVKREEIFVTSKLWNTAHKAEDVRPACEKTLRDLTLEYLDLYLMHWGMANSDSHWAIDGNGVLKLQRIPLRETWEAMQELIGAGLVRAIGVANFSVPMLIDLTSYATIMPAVLQVELHPYLQQSRLVEFCQYRGITVTAYSPLGSPGNYGDRGLPKLTEDPIITNIAKSHGKTSAQVLLRWGIERNTIVIPKSTHPERIRENADVFDFVLSEKDMQEIATLDRHLRFVDPYEWGKIAYFS
ncbi:aldo/keto reductase [Candidatus Kaiserbacteria bacterium]|nr:aldo/keto reductase [Candidatus Kaiserbacteria bacterium]